MVPCNDVIVQLVVSLRQGIHTCTSIEEYRYTEVDIKKLEHQLSKIAFDEIPNIVHLVKFSSGS